MSWIEHPDAERGAGQPLDETFWQKWLDRYSALQVRSMPAWDFNELHAFSGGSWETLSETYEIYIPPWAVGIEFRCGVSITTTNQDPAVGESSGIVTTRFKIGASDYSSEVGTLIGCKIVLGGPPDFIPSCSGPCGACDADETSPSGPHNKAHSFVVPAAMQGTVQTVAFEMIRGNTNTSHCEYNDDGAGGKKLLAWYFVEAA